MEFKLYSIQPPEATRNSNYSFFALKIENRTYIFVINENWVKAMQIGATGGCEKLETTHFNAFLGLFFLAVLTLLGKSILAFDVRGGVEANYIYCIFIFSRIFTAFAKEYSCLWAMTMLKITLQRCKRVTVMKASTGRTQAVTPRKKWSRSMH